MLHSVKHHALHQLTLRVRTLGPWEVKGAESVEVIEDIEIPAKQCANETCDRWFHVQEGRAEKRAPRKAGVLYCTVRCARAQAQREYRRRQKGAEA